MILLNKLLPINRIIIPLRSTQKEDALYEIIQTFYPLIDTNAAIKNLIEREKKMTTGIGLNIAIPHIYSKDTTELLIAAAVHHKGIEFNAIDNKPVKIICVDIAPENNPEIHRAYLQHLSQILYKEENRSLLMTALSADDFLESLELIENQMR